MHFVQLATLLTCSHVIVDEILDDLIINCWIFLDLIATNKWENSRDTMCQYLFSGRFEVTWKFRARTRRSELSIFWQKFPNFRRWKYLLGILLSKKDHTTKHDLIIDTKGEKFPVDSNYCRCRSQTWSEVHCTSQKECFRHDSLVHVQESNHFRSIEENTITYVFCLFSCNFREGENLPRSC